MNIGRPTSPRGYTLFEMMLVIASATLLLMMCGSLLHFLLRIDRATRSHLSDATAASRLARQFRQDVRTAAKLETSVDSKEQARLVLTSPDLPLVTYHAEGETLIRTETAGEVTVRRESYPMTRLGPLSFETDGPFVRLILSRRPDGPGVSNRPTLRFEARLGKTRDLAGLARGKP